MGNCIFRGTCELNNGSSSSEMARTIKVMTANGGVMELFPPIKAECITSEFPSHAIFTTQNPLLDDRPLLHTDPLRLDHSYFLLSVNKPPTTSSSTLSSKPQRICCETPYRMSLDTPSQQSHHQKWRSSSSDYSGLEMMSSTPRSSRNGSNNNGVWKVKLVISPEQLSEILAEEATTEELVERLRTVAKCGNYGSAATAANSDKWSISTAPNQFQRSALSIYGSNRFIASSSPGVYCLNFPSLIFVNNF